jgi:glycosyltransferase involved in cell wall biosynthesis
MEKNYKVLFLGDYNCHTGFATVSHNIKKELKNNFGYNIQLDIIAINYFGEPYTEEDGTYVISAVKSATKKDDFGRLTFLKVLKESNEYDGIFIIQDLGVILPIVPILKTIKEEKIANNKKQFKSIFYFPVDAPLVEKLTEGLEFFDSIVAYTEYGRKEVMRFKPELKTKLKVILHGNNSKHFFPLSQNEILEFRKEYFGRNADKFIITNVNRNQPRKDIPTTIFSFIEAKKQWEEHQIEKQPFLYLHMHPKDPMGWDIRCILAQTDLIEGEDYKLLDINLANNGASIEMLNKIYNASDVYLTTTLGEGFGLTLTEAMATKTPVICPKSTSFIEMTDNGKRAYTLDNLIPTSTTFDSTIRQQCDYIEVADTILYIAKGMQGDYENLNFLENYNNRIDSAYKWMQGLDWKIISKVWVDLFKKTL